jgi:hypothetical protein
MMRLPDPRAVPLLPDQHGVLDVAGEPIEAMDDQRVAFARAVLRHDQMLSQRGYQRSYRGDQVPMERLCLWSIILLVADRQTQLGEVADSGRSMLLSARSSLTKYSMADSPISHTLQLCRSSE